MFLARNYKVRISYTVVLFWCEIISHEVYYFEYWLVLSGTVGCIASSKSCYGRLTNYRRLHMHYIMRYIPPILPDNPNLIRYAS